MRDDKVKVYLLELIIIVGAFLITYVSYSFSRYNMASFLLVVLFFTNLLLKKERNKSIYESKVCLLSLILSILYVVILYFSGVVFGFEGSNAFSLKFILSYTFPIFTIIVASEFIRGILLKQPGKIPKFLSYVGFSIVYFFIFKSLTTFLVLHGFLAEIGFGLFSSLAYNLLFHYLTYHYGIRPTVIYSIITTMYPFVFPFVPRTSLFVHSVYNLLYPYLIYFVMENAFSKDNGVSSYRYRKRNAIEMGVVVFLSVLLIGMVSGRLQYGMIVIGSDSMKDTFRRGDAVVFKKYKNQSIHKGDIIIFKKSDLSIVHRIVDIRNNNGLVKYYTKGDANKDVDSFYALDSEIEGIMMFHIPYIGRPTLWFHDV